MTNNSVTESILEKGVISYQRKKESALNYLNRVINLFSDYQKKFDVRDISSAESKTNKNDNSDDLDYNRTLSLDYLNEIYQNLQNDTLKILMAGEFKAGKSTALNAMLGQKLLPTRSTPCTAVITELNYAQEPKAIIYFKEELDPKSIPQDLYNHAKEHILKNLPNKVPPIEIKYNGSMQDFQKELENYLVIPRSDKSQKDAIAETPYKLCKLSWPLELCRHNVEIVDSPGLNEAKERNETTTTYVPNVDLIVHVLSATHCYSQADQKFVELIKCYSDPPPLIFLVNRFDQVGGEDDQEEEQKRVKDYYFPILTKETPYKDQGVFFVSASRALKGRKEQNLEKFNSSGYEPFENKLSDIIQTHTLKIKLQSVDKVSNKLEEFSKSKISTFIKLLEQRADDLEEKYQNAQSDFKIIDKTINQIKKRIDQHCSLMHKNLQEMAKDFINDYVNNKLAAVIEKTTIQEISVFSIESDTKEAIQTLNSAVEENLMLSCNEWVKYIVVPKLEEFFGELRNNISSDLEAYKDQMEKLYKDFELDNQDLALNDQNLNINIQVDGFLTDFSIGGISGAIITRIVISVLSRFFAITNIIGWIITIVATIIGGMAFQSDRDKQVKEKYREELVKALNEKASELSSSIADEINNNINKRAQSLYEHLVNGALMQKDSIENAIRTINKGQGKIELQKLDLNNYLNAFSTLAQEGKELYKSIS